MTDRDDAVTAFLGLIAVVGLLYGLFTGQLLLGVLVFVVLVVIHLLVRLVRALERIAAELEARNRDGRATPPTSGSGFGGRPDEEPSWDGREDHDRRSGPGTDPGADPTRDERRERGTETE